MIVLRYGSLPFAWCCLLFLCYMRVLCVFAVPAGIYLAGRTGISLTFIVAMIVFMPLFVILPKLIQRGMQVDTQAVLIS